MNFQSLLAILKAIGLQILTQLETSSQLRVGNVNVGISSVSGVPTLNVSVTHNPPPAPKPAAPIADPAGAPQEAA